MKPNQTVIIDALRTNEKIRYLEQKYLIGWHNGYNDVNVDIDHIKTSQ